MTAVATGGAVLVDSARIGQRPAWGAVRMGSGRIDSSRHGGRRPGGFREDWTAPGIGRCPHGFREDGKTPEGWLVVEKAGRSPKTGRLPEGWLVARRLVIAVLIYLYLL